MTRVAAVDCGTNSIRLLVADVSRENASAGGVGSLQIRERERVMTIVRLGEGVDRTGQFSADALERTFAACADYARIIDSHDVSVVRFIATSASRDVSNREAFIDGVRQRLGVTPAVITGVEEAQLSFAGALGGLGTALLPAPALVVDIGGGSTECVLGSTDETSLTPEESFSADIGCVRLTERHLHGDPPTVEQIRAARRDINEALDAVEGQVGLAKAASMAGLAGTVTTMSAIALDLREYDPKMLHGSLLTVAQIDAITEQLLTMTRAERALIPAMHPGRVDVIAGGALVLQAVVARTALDHIVVSEADILDGIALKLGEEFAD
ncbi:MAG: Ppx/GppA phosphatase family protein [Candidatus Nanopelagicales bacterium]